MTIEDELMATIIANFDADLDARVASTHSTATAASSTLTMESLRRSLWQVEEAMRTARLSAFEHVADAMPPWHRGSIAAWMGMPVRESPYATTRHPARVHKHRRNQTEQYHRRIQKKWIKRWGYVEAPAIFVIDESVLAIGPRGPRREALIVHPTIAQRMRAAKGMV